MATASPLAEAMLDVMSSGNSPVPTEFKASSPSEPSDSYLFGNEAIVPGTESSYLTGVDRFKGDSFPEDDSSSATRRGFPPKSQGTLKLGSKRNIHLPWTPELKMRFETAVSCLGGLFIASPRGIHKLMAVSNLGLWQVKSYLTMCRRERKSQEVGKKTGDMDRGSPSGLHSQLNSTVTGNEGTESAMIESVAPSATTSESPTTSQAPLNGYPAPLPLSQGSTPVGTLNLSPAGTDEASCEESLSLVMPVRTSQLSSVQDWQLATPRSDMTPMSRTTRCPFPPPPHQVPTQNGPQCAPHGQPLVSPGHHLASSCCPTQGLPPGACCPLPNLPPPVPYPGNNYHSHGQPYGGYEVNSSQPCSQCPPQYYSPSSVVPPPPYYYPPYYNGMDGFYMPYPSCCCCGPRGPPLGPAPAPLGPGAYWPNPGMPHGAPLPAQRPNAATSSLEHFSAEMEDEFMATNSSAVQEKERELLAYIKDSVPGPLTSQLDGMTAVSNPLPVTENKPSAALPSSPPHPTPQPHLPPSVPVSAAPGQALTSPANAMVPAVLSAAEQEALLQRLTEIAFLELLCEKYKSSGTLPKPANGSSPDITEENTG